MRQIEKTKNNDQRLYDLIIYATGILVTMPIITLKFGGRHISAFTLSFSLFILVLVLEVYASRRDVHIGRMTKAYAGWLFLALISSFFGLFYFSHMPSWSAIVQSYIPKIAMFLVLLLLFVLSDRKEEIFHKLLKGFLIGCTLNLIWTSIDGLSFYVTGYSLNNRIFSDYARTYLPGRPYVSIILPSGIRSTGFNYDPAHLGGIIPITMLYGGLRKNYYLIGLSLLAVVFSQSTTALVSSVFLLAINHRKLNIQWPKSVSANFFRGAVLLLVGILCLGFLTRDTFIVQAFIGNLSGFTERISSVYGSGKITNIRLQYIIYTPVAILFSGLKVLTGTGFGTSSYPYIFSERINQAMALGKPWAYDPENTYINYLFDTGVFGLLLYLYIVFKAYSHFSRKLEDKQGMLVFASLGGIIVSGVFYHYVLTAYQVLMLIGAVILMDTQVWLQRRKSDPNNITQEEGES